MAIADIVMSLDNVIAVAAAANGSIPLLVIGLAISVPLIVAGAALIMALLTRLPALVWAGAALLGWIAGEVMATDPALQPALHSFFNGPVGTGLDGVLKSLGMAPQFANGGHGGEVVLGILGIAVVLVAGSIWRRRKMQASSTPPRRRAALTPRNCAVVGDLAAEPILGSANRATPASGRSPPRTRLRPPFPADDRVHPRRQAGGFFTGTKSNLPEPLLERLRRAAAIAFFLHGKTPCRP